ncbi:MAG: hypothetical protein SGI87_11725 [Flavobacteriales bacterium]|nr:hypothetical protein [Flavobacteriales bacterium]
MKKLFFLFLLSPLTSLFAQSDSSYFDIGVNSFQLLRIGDNAVRNNEWMSPYVLHMEAGFGKVGIRVGLGFYQKSSTELPSAFNGNTGFDNDTSSTDLRIGLAFRTAIGNKWSLKYGADFVLSNRNHSFNTTIEDVDGNEIENTTEESFSSSGLGLFLFPQFHITPRMSVATEMQLLYLSDKISETVTSTNFPDFDSQKDVEGNRFFLRPPAALYLIMRF